MKAKANRRPFRGGKPRRWRENQRYRTWHEEVMGQWNRECAITGIKEQSLLVVHHLYGASSNEALVYNVNNGIVLHKDIHTFFHNNYGYHNNTLEQFKHYLKRLINKELPVLISSQARSLNSLAGPETTVFEVDIERLNQLHDRLNDFANLKV
jgi:hypothetical protein